MLQKQQKTMYTMCVAGPYRALTTSRTGPSQQPFIEGEVGGIQVCALGARLFNSMARVANRMIWTVAPAAYQNGPDTPYLYAMAELWRSVAAYVYVDTTDEATMPDLSERPVVVNISDVWSWRLYWFSD